MTTFPPTVALTIAGSDSSGGAGLQADMKVFHRLGVYGTTVVTLITAQNTGGVDAIHLLTPEIVRQQFQAVLQDLPPLACKTGALGSIPIMEVVAEQLRLARCPKIIDPVMISKHGDPLMDDEAISYFRQHIVPLADLITPNRFELERLLNCHIHSLENAVTAARQLRDLGVKGCLLKLGRLGDKQRLVALLGDSIFHLEKPHFTTRSLHGTGCALSANITARLALTESIADAITHAVNDIHLAIENAPPLGKKALNNEGYGPIDLHFAPAHP